MAIPYKCPAVYLVEWTYHQLPVLYQKQFCLYITITNTSLILFEL